MSHNRAVLAYVGAELPELVAVALDGEVGASSQPKSQPETSTASASSTRSSKLRTPTYWPGRQHGFVVKAKAAYSKG